MLNELQLYLCLNKGTTHKAITYMSLDSLVIQLIVTRETV